MSKPPGPYSPSRTVGNIVYTSGQIGKHADSLELVSSDLSEQVQLALENLESVLADAGTSSAKVFKTTVFLTTMDHYSAVNEIYAKFFGENRPARSAVAVAELPLGGLFEIEAIATV